MEAEGMGLGVTRSGIDSRMGGGLGGRAEDAGVGFGTGAPARTTRRGAGAPPTDADDGEATRRPACGSPANCSASTLSASRLPRADGLGAAPEPPLLAMTRSTRFTTAMPTIMTMGTQDMPAW